MNVKKLKWGAAALLMSGLLLTGFDFKTSKTYNVTTDLGDVLQFELDTTGKFDMTLDSPFDFTKDGEEMGQAICMTKEQFDYQLTLFEESDEAKLLDQGEKDGHEYYFYSYYNPNGKFTEYDYFIRIEEANVSVVFAAVDTQETIEECFDRIKISYVAGSGKTGDADETEEQAVTETEAETEVGTEAVTEPVTEAQTEAETADPAAGETYPDTIELGGLKVTYDVPEGYEREQETEQETETEASAGAEDASYKSSIYIKEEDGSLLFAYIYLEKDFYCENEEQYLDITKEVFIDSYEDVQVSEIIETENELGTAKSIMISYVNDGETCYQTYSIQFVDEMAYVVEMSEYGECSISQEDMEKFVNLR